MGTDSGQDQLGIRLDILGQGQGLLGKTAVPPHPGIHLEVNPDLPLPALPLPGEQFQSFRMSREGLDPGFDDPGDLVRKGGSS